MHLAQLPDDVLLEVVSHLETAGDMARLSASCRRLHEVVRHGGWRGFVRGRFSSLAVGETDAHGGRWDVLADALTGQARAWERKAFRTVAYTEAKGGKGNFFRGYPDSAHPFSPVLDAGVVLGGGHELVVWGAGEDVIGRFRPVGRGGASGVGDAWFRMEGSKTGHAPVVEDVTAIKLATPEGKLGMFVGRASGDLKLISAEPGTAGQTVSSFCVPLPPVGARAASWSSVSYVDVLERQDLMIAGNRSTFCVFPLGSEEVGPVQPLDSQSFAGSDGNPRFIHDAKALSGDTLACALGTDEKPLRLYSLTPTGLVQKALSKGSRLMTAMEGGKQTTVRALESVSSGLASFRTGSNLLTAWDDGTIRLFDLRTPSPHDAVFRDTVDPYEKHSSLLSWGAHHFVAGSNDYPRLKTFDYRWPAEMVTNYHHTDALPCSGSLPFPPPPNGDFDEDVPEEYARPSYCQHTSGRRCTFHSASRTTHYRPNSCLIIEPSPSNNRQRPARIHALAKSSDAAGSFYVGLPSAIAEMQTASDGGSFEDDGHPNKVVKTAASKRGWRAEGADYCLIETGHGRVDLDGGYPGLGLSTFSPRLVRKVWYGGLVWSRPEVAEVVEARGQWHRWSKRFWDMPHFGLAVPGHLR